MDITDLFADEISLLADRSLVYAGGLEAMGESERAEAFRKRARMFKGLAAQEEHDQSAYMADGTIVLRKPYWLPEIMEILDAYLESAEVENDGVTKLAINVVRGMLEFQFAEEE